MLTNTEIAINKIVESANEHSTSTIIQDLIAEHENDKRYDLMTDGERYYDNEADILDRVKYYWKDGNKVEDETAVNNKVPNNWHKVLVDQKVGYVAGRPPIIDSEDEDFTELINNYLGERFDDLLPDIVTEVSNKGKDWLHVYASPEGDFKFMEVDARQCIPVYDTEKENNLTDFLRYYQVVVNGEERTRVEWWTPEDVTYYIEGESGEFKLDNLLEDNPQQPHFTKNGEGTSWGKIPFIKFANNKKEYPDLKQYKEQIDMYDKIISDYGNDLEELQEAVWVLVKYGGESLAEFQHNLRHYKALNVDEGGGAEQKTMDIPTEAKEKYLNRLEENLFLFGQGANIKTDRFGNSPSGVALQFLYSQLDIKANTLIRKFKRGIKDLCWFIAKFDQVSKSTNYDASKVSVTFNKTMIFNETEKIDNVSKSVGITSKKTARKNHPWINNVEEEEEQIQKEREEMERRREEDVDLDDYSDPDPDEE